MKIVIPKPIKVVLYQAPFLFLLFMIMVRYEMGDYDAMMLALAVLGFILIERHT